MELPALIAASRRLGASDLHLEAGLPAAIRVRGTLRTHGEPLTAASLRAAAQWLIGETHWPDFLRQRSYDLSRTIEGVRCRVNILHTARGIGLAIRLLASFQATIEKLNLHPDLKKFVNHTHGLVLVCGPTGSGKSSTLAALIQEVNLTETRHIITIESPIEYSFKPHRSYIRQREVGRDTPSFEQALLDALREDPEVLMVGEMRDPETMRLTLNASETGHLVFATVHSSTCAEALQRIVAAFPSEIQLGICAQLADSLVAVVAQRLKFRPDLNIRIPECEILTMNNPVKAHIRNREFFKIVSSMETGAEHGMWTLQRYRSWIEKRTNWFLGDAQPATVESEPEESAGGQASLPIPQTPTKPTIVHRSGSSTGRIEIEPLESDFGKILKRPE